MIYDDVRNRIQDGSDDDALVVVRKHEWDLLCDAMQEALELEGDFVVLDDSNKVIFKNEVQDDSDIEIEQDYGETYIDSCY